MNARASLVEELTEVDIRTAGARLFDNLRVRTDMDRRAAFMLFNRIADELIRLRFPMFTDRSTKNSTGSKRSSTYIRYSRSRPDGLYDGLFLDRGFLPATGVLGNLSFSISHTCEGLIAATGPLRANYGLLDLPEGIDRQRLLQRRWGGEWFQLGNTEEQVREGLGFFFDLFERHLRPRAEMDAIDICEIRRASEKGASNV